VTAADDGRRGSSDVLGVGIAGFGWMGQVHARAYARLLQHYPDALLRPRLVAVADPEPARQEQAIAAFGFATAVADYRDLLARDDVHAVSVCGPNFVHREIAVAAAEAGKHVWVEKPAGRDLADTQAIADAVHAASVQSAAGFNYRNAPAVEAARDLIAAGEIGEVETVDVYLLSDYAAHPDAVLTWRFDPALAGTGVLGDLASHGLDLALYVAGQRTGAIRELVADHATFIAERPEAASAAVSRSTTVSGGSVGPVGNEDQASVLLRFESGARGHLESSRVAIGEQCKYGIEVRGTKGAVAWDFRRLQELRLCVGQLYQDAAWKTTFVAPGMGELAAFQPGAGVAMGYDDLKVIEAERLVRSIAHGKPVGATIDDAVESARLIEAIVVSAAERRWVSV
jgi:predicted dehydrogenase